MSMLTVTKLELEDLAGDKAVLELVERPNGTGVVVIRCPNVWLDKKGTLLIADTLRHMAERVN